jgi:hypothetical protein
MSHIFDSFIRWTLRLIEGLRVLGGPGLCRALLTLMGGRIWAEIRGREGDGGILHIPFCLLIWRIKVVPSPVGDAPTEAGLGCHSGS